ncbi:MAG TPA: hypothetical protein DD415_04065 [Clostridiales bacterium]|nr:hypothetical protein [Clostridiales bacterium]
MKRLLKNLAAFVCAAVCALSFAACGSGNNQTVTPEENPSNQQPSTPLPETPTPPTTGEENPPEVTVKGECKLLGSPAAPVKTQYSSEGYAAFTAKVEKFAAKFAYNVLSDCDKTENYTVSPISVFMALGLAAECAGETVRAEILNALGVTYEELNEFYPVLFNSLNCESKGDNGEIANVLKLTNSVWVNEGTQTMQECINKLSDNYYAWSYSADFANKNKEANQAVREFVKEQTRGLIDNDFGLDENTLFALINTLYLKTGWNYSGEDLEFTPDKYSFKNSDGTVTPLKLLTGNYEQGRALKESKFSAFTATTAGGYKLKFIKPDDGYTVQDVFTEENIAKVGAIKYYNSFVNNKSYKTRCIFPEFKAKYQNDLIDLFKEKYGVTELFKFSDYTFFPLLGQRNSACSTITHVTDLTVDKSGIEGAAVTLVGGAEGAESKIVFEDFVLDRAFGFVITDSRDITLFSGVVNKI